MDDEVLAMQKCACLGRELQVLLIGPLLTRLRLEYALTLGSHGIWERLA